MKKILCYMLSLAIILPVITGCSVNADISEYVKGEKNDQVIYGNTKFALEMFKLLSKEDEYENIFISPLSITNALTMTLNGAEGTTEEAMKKALFYEGLDKESISKGNKYLLDKLMSAKKGVTVNIANSIWIRDDFPVKDSFKDLNGRMFKAEVQNLDFSDLDSVKTINNWIDKSTKGLIDQMIKGPIPNDAIMYLINAIYFKGDWTKKFNEKSTFSKNFKSIEGKTGTVSMMSRTDETYYYQNDKLKAVRLPYGKDEKVSMYVILPSEDIGFNKFIESMNVETFEEIRKNVTKRSEVLLQLPKFKQEYGIKELNSALTALGMDEAFIGNANFSGISDTGVAISNVSHKAVIEVNEQGSKAAGVTVVEMKGTSALLDNTSFIADRPFMYIIADDEDGSILFIGSMVK